MVLGQVGNARTFRMFESLPSQLATYQPYVELRLRPSDEVHFPSEPRVALPDWGKLNAGKRTGIHIGIGN